MVVPRNGLIGLARSRVQKKRSPKTAPFLLGSRPANGLQPEQILPAELEGAAPPWKGHDPLKHKTGQMYRYLENDHLVVAAGTLVFALLRSQKPAEPLHFR